MKQGKSIVLIGFMGSGKTTVGVRLSYKMKMVVDDTDKLIEKREGKSISDIFEQQGEDYFRNLETSILEDLIASGHSHIYSVGGGTPVREQNRPLLKKLGKVIYFRVKPETIYQRLKGDLTRPLLRGDDPLGKIKELLASREAAYMECADLVVDVDELTVEEIVEVIYENLSH